ncbi:MAG: ectoine/hydroxyectoine ABC transporter permease subunit EhuC, partial [Acidimicrobiia bacterium]
EVMKGTALVSLITLSDLAFEVQKLRVNSVVIADSATTPMLYLNVLAIYFVLAFLIDRVFKLAERRVAAKFGVKPPRRKRAGRPTAGVGVTG